MKEETRKYFENWKRRKGKKFTKKLHEQAEKLALEIVRDTLKEYHRVKKAL